MHAEGSNEVYEKIVQLKIMAKGAKSRETDVSFASN